MRKCFLLELLSTQFPDSQRDIKLGTGGVQGQAKGQRLMGKKRVMTQLGWQHAKVKSTKSNAPLGSKMILAINNIFQP